MATIQVKRLFEVYPSSPLAVQPLGIRVNDTIYAGGLAGVDPATGEFAPDLELIKNGRADKRIVGLAREQHHAS